MSICLARASVSSWDGRIESALFQLSARRVHRSRRPADLEQVELLDQVAAAQPQTPIPPGGL
jgi:hypothetical protein